MNTKNKKKSVDKISALVSLQGYWIKDQYVKCNFIPIDLEQAVRKF